MASSDRPLSPHLQVYRWQWTMAMSILHRITGVALVPGALGLVWWLLALAGPPEHYQRFTDCVGSPLGLAFAVAFLAALVYHFLNGIRHLAWDTGWGLDLPTAFRTGMVVLGLGVLLLGLLAWLLLRGAA